MSNNSVKRRTEPLLPAVPDLARRSERKRSQRLRLFRAIAELTRESGWGNVTATRVAARAGVSTKAFYAHFADKEQCLMELYRRMTSRAVSSLGEGLDDVRAWDERLRIIIARWFELLAAEPDFTHLYALDIWNASPATRRLALENTATLVDVLRAANSDACAQDPSVEVLSEPELQMLAGGLHRLVVLAAIEGRIGRLREVAPIAIATLLPALARHPYAARPPSGSL